MHATFLDPGELVQAILRAADPAALVRQRLTELPAGPVVLLAVGKAARAMAGAAAESLGDRVRTGLVIAPPTGGAARPGGLPDGWSVLEADHPLPTERNLAAADAAVELAVSLRADETLMVLLSGGASALLTLPVPGVSLDDLRAVTVALLRAGATIDELNCVRRRCERLKGGGLARLAAPCCRGVVALILSDVVGDKLEVIGSGPTAPDPTTYADALDVLERFGAMGVSPRIVEDLQRGLRGDFPEIAKPGDPLFARVENIIVGSNALAVEAAATELRRQGFDVVETRTGVTGEACDIGATLARRVRELDGAASNPTRRAIVWGGETTVTVRGTGTGGRNQELALAAAIELLGSANAAVLSFATDGVDGTSDAAGAMADGHTLAQARGVALDARAFLAANDSHTFFARLEATAGRRCLIRTGPTGTNVNDVMIGLAGAEG